MPGHRYARESGKSNIERLVIRVVLVVWAYKSCSGMAHLQHNLASLGRLMCKWQPRIASP